MGKRWERVWVIIGIIWAFPFLLTIPGWLGIRAYRRWQRGERPRPDGYIWWGILVSAAMVVSIVANAVTELS